ncbi:MAG: hypothetical protein SGPRY_009162, partial [Prymnesium sp.]
DVSLEVASSQFVENGVVVAEAISGLLSVNASTLTSPSPHQNATLVIQRSSLSELPAGVNYSLLLFGIVNPRFAHTTQGVSMRMVTPFGALIDVQTIPQPELIFPNRFVSASARLLDSRTLALTTLLLSFTTSNPIPPDGFIRLWLPVGAYFVAEGEVSAHTSLDGQLQASRLDRFGGFIELARSGGSETAAGANHTLELHGVFNPPSAGVAYLYNLSSHTAAGQPIDQLALSSALALQIVPNDLSDVTVSLTDARAGAVTEGNVSLTLHNPLPPRGMIALAFPLGFVLPSPPVAQLQLPSGLTLPTEVVTEASVTTSARRAMHEEGHLPRSPDSPHLPSLPNSEGRRLSELSNLGVSDLLQLSTPAVLLLRYIGADPTPASARVVLHFSAVTNPPYSQTTPRFEAWTLTADALPIDKFRHLAGNATTSLSPNQITHASAQLDDPRGGALTSARLHFTIFNPVPHLGQVCVSFPQGFRFYGPASGFGFGGRLRAYSTQLGPGLDVEKRSELSLCVHRRGEAIDSAVGHIELLLTNVIVPLTLEHGTLGGFHMQTQMASGELIDVLTLPIVLNVSVGIYAPAPPPHSAAPRGRTQTNRWAILLLSLCAVCCTCINFELSSMAVWRHCR